MDYPIMFKETEWNLVEEAETTTSLKCEYGDQVYSLGTPAVSFSGLLSLITTAVPYLQTSQFSVFYKDPDGDMVALTTTESLQEAYKLCPGVLRLHISKLAAYQEPVHSVQQDAVLDYNLLIRRLSAVFTVCLSKKAVGMGVVVEGGLAVTASPALQQIEAAGHATALFSTPGFECRFDPERKYRKSGAIVTLAFRYQLPTGVHFLRLQQEPPKRGDVALTLHKPIAMNTKACLKWVEVKDTSEEEFKYDCKEACGPAGSPVFSAALELIGIQVTDSMLSNVALPVSKIRGSYD